VEQDDLGLKMAGQVRGLMNHPQRGIQENNGDKDLFDIHRRIPVDL
jgi:hypothetical protein